ncbi:MAG: hypothetical protein QM790_18350 [Nibricoccus sp.]
MARSALGGLLLLAACKEKPRELPEVAGQITQPLLTESSGLASSRRSDDLLWSHNDSSGQPVLYGVSTKGVSRGSVRIAGVKNVDWEDVASFELDGRGWLLIADTGDNGGKRKDCSLIVIAEPDPSALSPGKEVVAAVAWRVPFVFPDGSHDCEAVAVDSTERKIYLISKRTTPATLYSLPLKPAGSEGGLGLTPLEATFVLQLKNIPQPDSRQKALPTPGGHWRNYVTAMDISPSSDAAVVLTYGDVLVYFRRHNEAWPIAFTHAPVVLAPHNLIQAEAAAFSRDGRDIFVTGERKAPLLKYKTPSNPTE